MAQQVIPAPEALLALWTLMPFSLMLALVTKKIPPQGELRRAFRAREHVERMRISFEMLIQGPVGRNSLSSRRSDVRRSFVLLAPPPFHCLSERLLRGRSLKRLLII